MLVYKQKVIINPVTELIEGTLKTLEDERLTTTFSRQFGLFPKLTTVILPSCSLIQEGAFMSCPELTKIYLPNCTVVHRWGFESCIKLSEVNLPKCSYVGNEAFADCINLSTVRLPECSKLVTNAFTGCHNLISLYLMSTSIVILSNINVFDSTPIGGYTDIAGQYGSIYVPTTLFDSYKIAENWSNFENRLVSVP